MSVTILTGDSRDVLPTLPECSVQCVVTSPPYWGLRDYGVDGQLGLEPTPEQFVANLVAVFDQVHRVLRDDGVVWLNLGDSYAGSWGAQGHTGEMASRSVVSARQIAAHPQRTTRTGSIPAGSILKAKDLIGIPWRVAFALQSAGWWLRSDCIWSKPNPMPESVTDRPTKAHEYVFLLSKSESYFYDADAVRERHAEADRPQSERRREQRMGRSVASVAGRGQSSKGIDSGAVAATHQMRTNPAGRNMRSVWNIATQPTPDAHFATFPRELARRCIAAGSKVGDVVLDPFGGSGTVGRVAEDLGRHSILIELNPAYVDIAHRKTAQLGLLAQEQSA